MLKKYSFNFSLRGLFAFALVLMPTIIWAFFPPVNDVLSHQSRHFPLLEFLMSASQLLMIALMIFQVTPKRAEDKLTAKLWFVTCLLCLSLYYLSWFLYYFNQTSPLLFLGMAILPGIYFISFTIWQKNYLCLLPATSVALKS